MAKSCSNCDHRERTAISQRIVYCTLNESYRAETSTCPRFSACNSKEIGGLL